MSVIKSLHQNSLMICEQKFIADPFYEVIMGSFAYDVSSNTSDCDLYGVCIPPMNYVFPHVDGYVRGFGPAPQNFETFQQHHIKKNDKEYDVAIYSIVKYFDLAAQNNPNIIDALFVPDRCVTHSDAIGNYMRKNRRHFLHRGSYHKFRGYSYAQLKRLKTSNRHELIEKYGFDVKNGYHIVRLALEAEQILTEGDLDIARNKEILKSIRRGEWTLDKLTDWFENKEKQLDELYISSELPYKPNMEFLKNVLLTCLEMKYGSLDKIYNRSESHKELENKLNKIKDIINE